jgi:hypothetical protein
VNARLAPAFVTPPPAPVRAWYRAAVLLPDVDVRQLRARRAELLAQLNAYPPRPCRTKES